MPERRPRRIATWALTAVGVAVSVACLGFRLLGPSDGAQVPFYTDAWTADGVRIHVLPGPPTGLRDGDVVTAVAGMPLESWLNRALEPAGAAAFAAPGADGSPLDYTVRRGQDRLQVPVALAPHAVGGLLADFWSAIVLIVVLQVVAAWVLLKRPEAEGSVALALVAVGVTGSTIPWLLGVQVSDLTLGWPLLLYVVAAGGLYMLIWPAGAFHLSLALLEDRPPARRSVAVAYALPLLAYVAALVGTRLAAPSTTVWMGRLAAAQGVVIVPTVLAGAALGVLLYRRAPRPVRARARWAMAGGSASLVAGLALLFLPQLVFGHPFIPWSAVGIVALPLPIGIAASILRSGLFDIDVVVNRALVYGGATGAIVAIYVGSVTLVGRVLGLENGLSASLLATGLAAVAALPIRDALQRVVNRLMYGDRDDPYRAVTRLGQRLEATLDPFEAPTVIVRTVAESLRLPWVALRLRPGPSGEPGRTIAHGREPAAGAPIAVPIVYGAEVVADMLVAPRAPAEPLSAADQSLLADLARQAGPAVHALRLTLDLAESRERLVAAREEERRRIRRDLHDGLGPTLAAIGLRAEVAGELAAQDPAEAARVLDEMRVEVRGAIGDIRRLVDALRPPALDELGLVGAIEAQAARLGPSPTLAVTADGALPELPAAVEVAAYRIAVEAMTNAARHAEARTCLVRVGTSATGLVDAPGVLEVEVADDGVGLPDGVRPGIGLVSMRERAAEVGGTVSVTSSTGKGTRVLARLPFGSVA